MSRDFDKLITDIKDDYLPDNFNFRYLFSAYAMGQILSGRTLPGTFNLNNVNMLRPGFLRINSTTTGGPDGLDPAGWYCYASIDPDDNDGNQVDSIHAQVLLPDTGDEIYGRIGTGPIGSIAWIPWVKISNIGDLDTIYAKKISPVFTGAPTAPSPTISTNSTQIATTLFLQLLIKDYITATETYFSATVSTTNWRRFAADDPDYPNYYYFDVVTRQGMVNHVYKEYNRYVIDENDKFIYENSEGTTVAISGTSTKDVDGEITAITPSEAVPAGYTPKRYLAYKVVTHDLTINLYKKDSEVNILNPDGSITVDEVETTDYIRIISLQPFAGKVVAEGTVSYPVFKYTAYRANDTVISNPESHLDEISYLGCAGFLSNFGGWTEIYIPSTAVLGGRTFPVKRVEPRAFMFDTRIRKVRISEGITYIGNNAFYGCTLYEFHMPESLKFLGVAVMSDGASLTHEITFPANLETIGSLALYSCNLNTTIHFGKYVKPYDYGGADSNIRTLLYNWNNLESITVDPENIYLKSIDGVLYQRKPPVDFDVEGNPIPNEEIYALLNYPRMRPYEVDGGTANTYYQVVPGCEVIAQYAVLLSTIDEIRLPSSLRVINSSAFTGTMINNPLPIGAFVEYIGFGDSSIPCGYDVDPANPIFASDADYSLYKTTIDENEIRRKTTLLSYHRPDGVTTYTVHPEVIEIGTRAIHNQAITHLIIPDNVEVLTQGFAYSCSTLKSIQIGANAKMTYGGYGMTYISNNAAIEEVILSPLNPYFELENEMLYHTADGYSCLTMVLKSLTSDPRILNVRNGTTVLGYVAFSTNRSAALVVQITLPETLVAIPSTASINSTSCTSLVFPASLTLLAGASISGNSLLEEVTFLNPNTTIPTNPFTNTPANLLIKCYRNSTAETMAKRYNYRYEFLD